MKQQISSKTLSFLDELGVKYTIRGTHANLCEWDSLAIDLGGKYADSWKRWSTNEHGNDGESLVYYLVKNGMVDINQPEIKAKVDSILQNHQLQGELKKVTIAAAKPISRDTMVYNPAHYIADDYLISQRLLNPQTVKLFFDKDVILQDGRDNIRFLWVDPTGKVTGADVQGTRIDYEAYGKRGTLKMILPGSKGFFQVHFGDEIKSITLFEAAIDLMSYVEFLQAQKIDLTGRMFVSMSGSTAKIEQTIRRLEDDWHIDAVNTQWIIATDNDEAGNSVFTQAKQLLPEGTAIMRALPNGGKQLMTADHTAVMPKDWNEFLQLLKHRNRAQKGVRA